MSENFLRQDFINDEIDTGNLPQVENLHLIPLDSSYRKLMYLSALSTIILPAGWIIAAFVFELWEYGVLGIGVLVLTLLIFGINMLLVKPAFSKKGYALREQDVVYQSGLLYRSLTILPFNRVQHCEISRGPLSRLLGLSELNVYTAGGSASDLMIPGLPQEEASRICEYILRKVKATDEEE